MKELGGDDEDLPDVQIDEDSLMNELDKIVEETGVVASDDEAKEGISEKIHRVEISEEIPKEKMEVAEQGTAAPEEEQQQEEEVI